MRFHNIRLEHMQQQQEFQAEDLAGALDFIEALPPEVSRVWVEVWEKTHWRFVYGDERRFVSRLLGLVIHERRFRLRGVSLPEGDSPPMFARELDGPFPP